MENVLIIGILVVGLIIYDIVNAACVRSFRKAFEDFKELNFDSHTMLANKADRADCALSDNIDKISQRVAALENEKMTVERLAQEASDRYQAEIGNLLGYNGIKDRKRN